MSEWVAIAEVLKNEDELVSHINNIDQLSEKELELKSFYKQQINFLKNEYKEKKITKNELLKKLAETKEVYQIYHKKMQDFLNLNYSLAIWEYQQSNVLKKDLDYLKLKKDYLKKMQAIKNHDDQKLVTKKLKKDYQILKKTLPAKYIIIIAIISTIGLLLAGLLVNYLYYFKIANNGQGFSFKNQNHITAFVFVCIGILLIFSFLIFVVRNIIKRIFLDKDENLFKTASIGFAGAFTDTIGVGSFSITVATLNATNTVKNVKKLPGTLNLGLTIPNLFAGTLFVSAIQVELVTLITLVIAAMFGAFFGAKLVSKVDKKFVALFVAIALAIAGVLMILGQTGIFNNIGTKGLTGWRLAVGIISFFVIGGLQSFGVGLYAPALAIISLLGMETIVAFPIMTCASGFAMPTTAWAFHRDNNYSPKVSIGLLIGGIFGSIAAFFIVFVGIQGGIGIKMDNFTYYLKWFAILVMYYAAFTLLKKYLNLKKATENQTLKVVENYYQIYETDFLKMFEQKLQSISQLEILDQEIFEQKIFENNINLLLWR
ncbi:MAG: TSUP family transporter [Spiroplasma sp.]|nr:TSUP family transporter [Spiroplasma sp.]